MPEKTAVELWDALTTKDEAEPVGGLSRSDSVSTHGYRRLLKALEALSETGNTASVAIARKALAVERARLKEAHDAL